MNLLSSTLMLIFLLSTPISAKDVIRLTNGEWPPYLSGELPHYGYASRLVKEVFAEVGVEVEYEFFPWKRSFEYAKWGKGLGDDDVWHGTVVWVYTEERAKDFLYTDVAISDIQVFFHLKSFPLNWKTVEDLRGKSIGGTLHTAYPILEEAEKQGIFRIERAGYYDVLFKRLLRKRIDAVPLDRNVGKYFLRTSFTSEEQKEITYSPTVIQERKYHVILTKKIKENERFIRLFNEGLKKLKANGRYDELSQSLSRGEYDKPNSPDNPPEK